MKTIVFRGLRIRIENPKGSVRSGVDSNGKPWAVTMSNDYGEILGSMGVDGDPVDCFVGDIKNAPWVYVIHQTKKSGQGYDEDKCMLGFQDAMTAKAAFYRNYDDGDKFYGNMSVMSVEDFKRKVMQTKTAPCHIRASKINIAIQLYAALDSGPLHVGDQVLVDGLRSRGVIVGIEGKRIKIRYLNNEYVSRDAMYVRKLDSGNYKSKYISSSIENEGIPEEAGRGNDKWIVKEGTQFCIRSNGVDKNFGCWPSREKAEAVMRGESFITPDLPKNLLAGKVIKQSPAEFRKSERRAGIKPYVDAGGPGSGRKSSIAKGLNQWKSRDQEIKQAAKDPKQITLFSDDNNTRDAKMFRNLTKIYGEDKATQMMKDMYEAKVKRLKAFSPPGIKFHIPSPFKVPTQHGTKPAPASMNHVGNVGHKKPNMPMKNGKGSGHRFSNPAFMAEGLKTPDSVVTNAREKMVWTVDQTTGQMQPPGAVKDHGRKFPDEKKIQKAKKSINADFGEPNAGAYQHAHIDPMMWFHPPSLDKNKPGKVNYTPTDDPMEKDNKYLDVTKRNSKDTKDQRMKLLKRAQPAGPAIPVRTTLVSPTLNSYLPMSASAIRQHRRHGKGQFRAYGAAQI